MLRSLVGSEMCIRDRVSTQSTGFGATAMASFSCRGLLCLITITLALGYQHARILWCDAGVTLNSNKFGATASATASGAQELETYSDWYESYMRWTLRGLEGQGQVTKATVRLYTTRSDGPMHIYMQWLNSTAWGDDTGVSMQWHNRPRFGPIVSSFKAYTRMSNVIDVTEQIQAIMTLPDPEEKKFGIRLFQEGQTMVPFGGSGTWQRFASLEHDDYHTRPYLEVQTDCEGCIGGTTDYNQEDTYEGIDNWPGPGTPLDAARF
eukprot:TRINITY_DN738_c0_g1_i19.p1 TRINITY_DN738_c0_g1~~TRINITY_DN738_c0_g1_i19.p1  ORF type:complete len:286 (-),score=77.34 TRINITY_DN738_c0_g1_i19:310-1101(-)